MPAAQIKTFTIGFTEPSFDESEHAKARRDGFSARASRGRTLDLDSARDAHSARAGQLDEPLGDRSILPTYLLSPFTRRHVTVALSGDGGDELFAGYDPFKALAPARLYQRAGAARLHASDRSPAGRFACRFRRAT